MLRDRDQVEIGLDFVRGLIARVQFVHFSLALFFQLLLLLLFNFMMFCVVLLLFSHIWR